MTTTVTPAQRAYLTAFDRVLRTTGADHAHAAGLCRNHFELLLVEARQEPTEYLAGAVPFPCKKRSGYHSYGYPTHAKPCECEHPLFDVEDLGHCVRCGHDHRGLIDQTWNKQARRTGTTGGRMRLATAA